MNQLLKSFSIFTFLFITMSCGEKINTPENPEGPIPVKPGIEVPDGKPYKFIINYDGRQDSSQEAVWIFNSETGAKAQVTFENDGSTTGRYCVTLNTLSRYNIYAIARAEVDPQSVSSISAAQSLKVKWYNGEPITSTDEIPLFFMAEGITPDEFESKLGYNNALPLTAPSFIKITLNLHHDDLMKKLHKAELEYLSISGFPAFLKPFGDGADVDMDLSALPTMNLVRNGEGEFITYIPAGEKVLTSSRILLKEKISAIGFEEKHWIRPTFSFDFPESGIDGSADISMSVLHKYDYGTVTAILYNDADHQQGYREKKTFRFLDGKSNHLGYNIPWGDNDFTLQGTYNPDGVGSGSGDDIRWAQNADFLSRAQFKTLNTGIETYRFWTDFYNGCGMKCSACGHETYGYPYDSASQAERSHWIQMFTSAWATYPVFNCSRCGALFGDISAGDTQLIENGKPGQTGHNLVYTEGRSVVKLQLPYIFLEAGEQCPVWFEDTSTGCKDTVWVSVGRFEDQVFYMKDPHRFYVGQKIEVNWDDKDQPIMCEFLIGEESAKYAGGGGGGQIFFSLISEGRFVVEFTDPMTEKRIGRFALKVKEPNLSTWKTKVEL